MRFGNLRLCLYVYAFARARCRYETGDSRGALLSSHYCKPSYSRQNCSSEEDEISNTPCPPSKYRSASGECNNVRHRPWGRRGDVFIRLMPAHYANSKFYSSSFIFYHYYTRYLPIFFLYLCGRRRFSLSGHISRQSLSSPKHALSTFLTT